MTASRNGVRCLVFIAGMFFLILSATANLAAQTSTTIEEMNYDLNNWVGVYVQVSGVVNINGSTIELWIDGDEPLIKNRYDWIKHIVLTDGGALPPDIDLYQGDSIQVTGIVTTFLFEEYSTFDDAYIANISVDDFTVLSKALEKPEIQEYDYYDDYEGFKAAGDECKFAILIGGYDQFYKDLVDKYNKKTTKMGVLPQNIIVLMPQAHGIPAGNESGGSFTTGGHYPCTPENIDKAIEYIKSQMQLHNCNTAGKKAELQIHASSHGSGYHNETFQAGRFNREGYRGGRLDKEPCKDEDLKYNENNLRFENSAGTRDIDNDGTPDLIWGEKNGRRQLSHIDKHGNTIPVGSDTNGDGFIDNKDSDWQAPDLDDSGDISDVAFDDILALGNKKVISDDEMREKINDLTKTGLISPANIRVELDHCFSGSFVDDLKGCVAELATACKPIEYSFALKDQSAYFETPFMEEIANGKTWKEAYEKAKKAVPAIVQGPQYTAIPTIYDNTTNNTNLVFHWTKDNAVLMCSWWLRYKIEGSTKWVDRQVAGEINVWRDFPELKGKKVAFRFYPPDGATDWKQTITSKHGNTIVTAGNIDTGSPWHFNEFTELPDVEWRIPDIAPSSVVDSTATLYTFVNLEEYYNANPFGFLDGDWEVGQTLSQLGIDIIDGQIPGIEGIYWASTDFIFDAGSEWGFIPEGGSEALFNTDESLDPLVILAQHTNVVSEVVMPSPEISINKNEDVLQGHYTCVPIVMENSQLEMGAFDFLIAYDASALAFAEAEQGQLLEDCDWEYFTYRHGVMGNCGEDYCPSGLMRIIAMAETNDGSNHPSCNGPESSDQAELAKLTFLVSNDRTLECMYVPIRFFWNDCGDNVISSVDGNIAYIDRAVYDFTENLIWDEEDDDEFPETDRIPYVGAPDDCLNTDPEKPSPVRFIDFVNGGVDIICADSIDARGDINLNGVAHEVADATVFVNYFIYGMNAFTVNAEGQIAASDVNADGIPLSVADLTYLIRIIVGDALPYAKLTSAVAEVTWQDGILAVDTEIGAARVICRGEVVPVLAAENMDMKYAYNSDDDLTSILVYSMEKDHRFSGEFLRIDGDLVDIELATYEGSVVRLASVLIPTTFMLYQNYPNPFNPNTDIAFYLPKAANATLEIFNVAGQKVATLVDERLQTGKHTYRWDGTNAASGVYFYRLTAGEFVSSRKMMLLK